MNLRLKARRRPCNMTTEQNPIYHCGRRISGSILLKFPASVARWIRRTIAPRMSVGTFGTSRRFSGGNDSSDGHWMSFGRSTAGRRDVSGTSSRRSWCSREGSVCSKPEGQPLARKPAGPPLARKPAGPPIAGQPLAPRLALEALEEFIARFGATPPATNPIWKEAQPWLAEAEKEFEDLVGRCKRLSKPTLKKS